MDQDLKFLFKSTLFVQKILIILFVNCLPLAVLCPQLIHWFLSETRIVPIVLNIYKFNDIKQVKKKIWKL